jgi:hypothetical protein
MRVILQSQLLIHLPDKKICGPLIFLPLTGTSPLEKWLDLLCHDDFLPYPGHEPLIDILGSD